MIGEVGLAGEDMKCRFSLRQDGRGKFSRKGDRRGRFIRKEITGEVSSAEKRLGELNLAGKKKRRGRFSRRGKER